MEIMFNQKSMSSRLSLSKGLCWLNLHLPTQLVPSCLELIFTWGKGHKKGKGGSGKKDKKNKKKKDKKNKKDGSKKKGNGTKKKDIL